LTLNPDTDPNTYVFDADRVVLGHSQVIQVDLSLPDRTLQEKHLTITALKEGYLIENTAQDPFATVNDTPFGKKRLTSGDLIGVGSFTLLFEEGIKSSIEPQKKEEKKRDSVRIETEKRVEKRSTLFFSSIILLFTLSFFSLLKVGLDFLEKEREKEEHMAIQVVADTAMALMYTKIHETGPERQLFSDPHFIEKGLKAVLGKIKSSATEVDAQGRFKEIPYILRIYTSPDLKQFLVMAQPTPSLFNWLRPKESVVVDSNLMDLRKFDKIKELNRLLVYLNSPEEGNFYANLVTQFLSEQPKVSLLELGRKHPGKGYTPPQELTVIKPQAQNYLYNAPRYYRFTQDVIFEALKSLEGKGDKAFLKSVFSYLGLFRDPIYYTTQGSKNGRELKRALKTWIDREYFVGTLFLGEEGEILSQALVLEDSPVELSHLKFQEEEIAFGMMNEEGVFDTLPVCSDLDLTHPLYLRMKEISSLREQMLTPIGSDLISLIEAQNKTATPNFFETIKTVLNRYEESCLETEHIVIHEIENLYKEYSFIPFRDFCAYAKKAHLEESLTKCEIEEAHLSQECLVGKER
jgi:hypothetical protein